MRTPGVWASTAQTSVAEGTSWRASVPKSVESAVVRTSTTGASPVTVTVSATLATSRVTGTVMVRFPSTMMPSRTSVWNPEISNRRL